MAQIYTTNCYASGHVVDTDMTNIENNFAALKSSFSGAVTPGNTVAGMFWMDTNKNLLKVRNFNDTAWLGIMQASISHKLFVYRNAAETGWAIDGAVTDRLIAIKGGATYTNGGAVAGTWTMPWHVHQWYKDGGAGARGQSYDSVGVLKNITKGAAGLTGYILAEAGLFKRLVNDYYTGNPNDVATWRPAAAVTTLQYLDI